MATSLLVRRFALLLWMLAGCTGNILAPTAPVQNPGAPNDVPIEPPPVVGEPVVERSTGRRLTRHEVEGTLKSVFGIGAIAAVAQLPDESFTPFDNDVQTQAESLRLVEAIEAISIEVSAWVVAQPARMSAVLPCTTNDPACFESSARSLGRVLHRHPLEPSEVEAIVTLLSDPISGGTFEGAVEMLVRFLIVHPDFLYRLENGREDARAELTGFEIATRLSLLLVGRAPDRALLDAAEAGRLATPEGRRAEATLLLDSPAGLEQQRRFVAMWLGYSKLETTGLEAKMRAESDALVDRAFGSGADFRTLFSSDQTFVDAELATHYGLSGGATAAFVDYGSADRRGILSHGSFSIAGAKFSDTSPTRRGKFVRERLFCQKIALPTVNVDVDQPPMSSDPNACKVDRYVAHRADPTCAGCHAQTDPIGFGLENLDQLGRYRTHDEGRPECVISGQGQLDPNTPFTGPKALATLVANNDRVPECMANHLLRFSGGRAERPGDTAAAKWLAAQLKSGGYSVRALLLAFVAHPNFALRVEEP